MAVIKLNNRMICEFGAVNKLAKELKSLKVSRPLICTDPGIKQLGLLDQVKSLIPDEFEVSEYTETPGNPTEDAVLAATSIFKEKECDSLISIGGGSAMDLAKAVSLLATHDEPLSQYAVVEGGVRKIGAMAPHIAIPTTAGTGSEVSTGSVVTCNDGRKLTFVHNNLVPKVAIADPELTLGLPKILTAATGMDAVTHCIEAYLSAVDNPPADGIALNGLELAIGQGNLEKAVLEGSDKHARKNMMMAAAEGAWAFNEKGLGSVHAMSHACGRMKELRLHHGTLNAVILPHILRFNQPVTEAKVSRLKVAMGYDASVDLADEISKLNERLGIPASLGEMGVTTDLMPQLIEHTLKDMTHFGNPREATAEDYQQLFTDAIG